MAAEQRDPSEGPEVMTLVQAEDDPSSLMADVRAVPLAGVLGLLHG